MTFMKSFFNKAVYKSTVKRFLWGSVLYFVLLFLTTNLLVMLTYDFEAHNLVQEDFYRDSELCIFPTLFAMIVPTVVALLVWRFLHSKKQSIFIHSLPVTRRANYISTLLAAFTLMVVPVVLNGIILGVTVSSFQGNLYSIPSLLSFIGLNLLILFLFFSVATFAATLTGNSFAVMVINGLLHGALYFFLVAGEGIAEAYIYGYSSTSEFLNRIMYSNYLSLGVNMMENTSWNAELLRQVILAVLFAIFFYVASYFLYKKRKVEEVGSVAGFRILNGIFKYGVTLLVAMMTTASFAQDSDFSTFPAILFVAILSAVVYIGTEMILKKSVHVLGSLRGFLVFGLLFAGGILIFSETSFFGYETRVPAAEDVKSVAFYQYYRTKEEPFSDDPAIISQVIENHSALITPEYMEREETFNYWDEITNIHIKYVLKDGSLMERTYQVKLEESNEMLAELYTIQEYKRKMEVIFEESDDIVFIYQDWNMEDRILEQEELVKVLQEDILAMGYEDIHHAENTFYPELILEFRWETEDDSGTRLWQKVIYLNSHYEKTLAWLLEKGYVFEWEGGYYSTFTWEEQ